MKLFIESFTFNGFQENTYIVYSESGDAVIIDPGCYTRDEEQTLLSFVTDKKLNVLALLNTHAHIDHVLGNSFVLDTFKVDFYLHKNDVFVLNSVVQYSHMYGFDGYKISPQPTQLLEGGEKLKFGSIDFDVLFTPGHAPGHVVFHNFENSFVINGDVLFKGSFGRTDLPGGDMEVLKKSIFEVMFKLPKNTVVYAGHGPSTTIEEEKRTNYIMQF